MASKNHFPKRNTTSITKKWSQTNNVITDLCNVQQAKEKRNGKKKCEKGCNQKAGANFESIKEYITQLQFLRNISNTSTQSICEW